MPEPRCILSKFYIKPQRWTNSHSRSSVVSYRNSTSNHNYPGEYRFQPAVVSYRNSTSNHNSGLNASLLVVVVSYRNSTSNHNPRPSVLVPQSVVSYRNSTSNHNPAEIVPAARELYLIEILHQTTTHDRRFWFPNRCILSKFYIKPQLRLERELTRCSCILSKFYIKPQLIGILVIELLVVSYRNSTSNHNSFKHAFFQELLYLIEILHQTTTPPPLF